MLARLRTMVCSCSSAAAYCVVEDHLAALLRVFERSIRVIIAENGMDAISVHESRRPIIQVQASPVDVRQRRIVLVLDSFAVQGRAKAEVRAGLVAARRVAR